MKIFPCRFSRGAAFTLIELLVVIAIIVALAAMVFPIMNKISANQAKAIARAEVQQIDTAIKAYQAKYGFYPPDFTNAVQNPLYYELVGARTTYPAGPNTPAVYVTLDGASTITSNQLFTTYRLTGLANSSISARAGDEQQPAVSFLKEIKPFQLSGTSNTVRRLLCTAGVDSVGAAGNSPWRYNSSNPTNNPGAFDLWVDLYIGGKTNRFSNWAAEPQLAQ